MNIKKSIGIWMDHSTANLINYNESMSNRDIESEFTHHEKVETMQRSENIMHNKEQQMHEAFYKTIADEIKNYDHVLLFGPTNAKSELHNFLEKDLHFKDIIIDVVSADNMTDNEKDAFVKKHFE